MNNDELRKNIDYISNLTREVIGEEPTEFSGFDPRNDLKKVVKLRRYFYCNGPKDAYIKSVYCYVNVSFLSLTNIHRSKLISKIINCKEIKESNLFFEFKRSEYAVLNWINSLEKAYIVLDELSHLASESIENKVRVMFMKVDFFLLVDLPERVESLLDEIIQICDTEFRVKYKLRVLDYIADYNNKNKNKILDKYSKDYSLEFLQTLSDDFRNKNLNSILNLYAIYEPNKYKDIIEERIHITKKEGKIRKIVRLYIKYSSFLSYEVSEEFEKTICYINDGILLMEKEGLTTDIDYFNLLTLRARCFLKNKNEDLAFRDLKNLYEIHHIQPELFAYNVLKPLIDIYIKKGNLEKSFEIISKALHSKLSDEVTLIFYRLLDTIYTKRGSYKEAYENFVKINKLSSKINKESEKQSIKGKVAKERLLGQLKKTEMVTKQNRELSYLNKRILDSIRYASLIQNSILPREEEMSQYINDFFTIWKPRDIVGGDLYWFFPIPKSKNFIISVIDCTGHGVPGAFMSMTANSILNNIVREKKIYEPDRILNHLHKEIRYTLHQQSDESEQIGMDISVCYVDVKSNEIHFSGAIQYIFFIKSNLNEIERIRGDRFSIGGKQRSRERNFTKKIINYDSGDSIYLFSDGLADQKVRIDGKETKYKIKRVKEMFLKYNPFPIEEQKEKIEEELAELQGEIKQRDDIVVVGVKL